MSCNLIIDNQDNSTGIFTVLLVEGQPAGKGRVIFSDTVRGSYGAYVEYLTMMIGFSAKECKWGEVVDLSMLTNAMELDCRAERLIATWKDKMFKVRN